MLKMRNPCYELEPMNDQCVLFSGSNALHLFKMRNVIVLDWN
jgi:hypothetical protein